MTRFAVITAIALGAASLAGCGGGGSTPATKAGKAREPAAQQAAAPVTETIKVSGMTCSGCETSIKASVAKLDGVRDVKADHKAGQATVTYDPAKVDKPAIKTAIERLGYKVEG